jgi:hypothetical protein
MAHRRSFLILLTVISSIAGTSVVLVVGQHYRAYEPNCSTTGNYTTGSQYQVNLVKLMSELPSSAIANRGFHYGTAGEAPDSVFGLAMCYADLNYGRRSAAGLPVQPGDEVLLRRGLHPALLRRALRLGRRRHRHRLLRVVRRFRRRRGGLQRLAVGADSAAR